MKVIGITGKVIAFHESNAGEGDRNLTRGLHRRHALCAGRRMGFLGAHCIAVVKVAERVIETC